jgi:predicted SAM-dependent methyltransferase
VFTPGADTAVPRGGPSFQTNPHFVEPPPGTPRKLHIGGKVRMAGWELLNVVAGNSVDHIGNAKDLSRFAEDTFQEIYASHVLEHFDYAGELVAALKEWRRVLVPGGRLLVSVPDLDVLAALMLDKDHLSVDERRYVMQMIFGGHLDQYDYHQTGLNLEFLAAWLTDAGFVNIRQVDGFGLVSDTSSYAYKGHAISLNVIAEKG